MARSIFEMTRHKLVDTYGHLPRIDIQPEMLEHSLFFILDFGNVLKIRILPVLVIFHYLESSSILPSSVVSQSETDAPMVRAPLACPGDCLYTTALRESL